MLRNKRGQFYLIAAVIIIMVIVGFIIVSNYSKQENYSVVYDLGEELGIESQNVLDYGLYNNYDDVKMNELLQHFTEIYAEKAGEDVEIVFITGDEIDLSAYTYIGESGVAELSEEDENLIDEEAETDCQSACGSDEGTCVTDLCSALTGNNKNTCEKGCGDDKETCESECVQEKSCKDISKDNFKKCRIECGGEGNPEWSECQKKCDSDKKVDKEGCRIIRICEKWTTHRNKRECLKSGKPKRECETEEIGYKSECESGNGMSEELREKIAESGLSLRDYKKVRKELRVNKDYSKQGRDVRVKIKDNEYPFELKSGENFYFIISQEIEGSQYVVTN